MRSESADRSTASPRSGHPRGSGRLTGARVVDLGWIWAGPLVTAGLASLGADVVKVESARRFDPYRLRGVERLDVPLAARRELSPSFHRLNQGKRSVDIDLKSEAGHAVLLRLVGAADMLVENFSAGTLDRLGLSWEVLRAVNPRLVVLSMSGGGETGRWKQLRAYALIASALAGYESLIGYPGEVPLGGPTVGVADPTAAAFGFLAATAALHRAGETGLGCHIDLSNTEAVIALLPYAFLDDQDTAADRPHLELTLRSAGVDAWLAVVVTNESEWEALRVATGTAESAPVWAELPASAEAARLALEKWSSGRDRDEAVAELVMQGLAAVPILDAEEIRSADAPARTTIEHPLGGAEVAARSPWGETVDPRPAPLLGQHTDAVLREWLGASDAEIDGLRAAGAVS